MYAKIVPIIALIAAYTQLTQSTRLTQLFENLNGYNVDHNFRGVFHVGNEYAIFLRSPKLHENSLVYELYEVKYSQNGLQYQPRLLAISNVPVDFIKDQLRTFAEELRKAHFNDEIVPGTNVLTLREWQIDRALMNVQGWSFNPEPQVLRTVVEDIPD